MYDSEAIPASPVQKLINQIANADLGVTIKTPGLSVRKINYSQVQVVENENVLSNEDFFLYLQTLEDSVWHDFTDSNFPPNANGVETLVE